MPPSTAPDSPLGTTAVLALRFLLVAGAIAVVVLALAQVRLVVLSVALALASPRSSCRSLTPCTGAPVRAARRR